MTVEISTLDLRGAGRRVLEEVDALIGFGTSSPASVTLHQFQCARVEVSVNAAIKRKRGVGSTAYEDRAHVAGRSVSTLTIGDMRYKGVELTFR